MKHVLKYIAILSILAFFFCSGWVVITADGVAFRYFLLSALVFVFSVFGGFAWIVYKEVNRRDRQAKEAVAEIVEKLQANNKNLN